MPGKTERGSIFRLPVYLPDAAWHGHPSLAVRWPGVLAGHKALVQGTFQMVANRHGSVMDAASASGSAIARCRQSRSGSPAGVAAVEFLEIAEKHLRSIFDSATLTADGFGVEISRAGSYSRRCHFDSLVDCRESGSKPAQTLREALRSMAVETGQRRVTPYGLPRLVAHATPGR